MYTAPKLRRYWMIVPLFMAGIVYILWTFQHDASPLRPENLMIGLIWLGSLILLWIYTGKFARSVEVVNDSLAVELTNGKKYHFSIAEIQEIRLKDYLGFREAIISTKNIRAVRITSHVSNFEKLLEVMGYSQKRLSRDHKKIIFRSYLILAFFILLTISTTALAYFHENEPTEMILYLASIFNAALCILIVWMLYKLRKSGQ